MNRVELQALATERVADASALLTAGQWSGAYYLAGYAVECALKSCVLAYIERTGIIFLEKKFAEKCWTHDVEQLVQQAGLAADRAAAVGANQALGHNWLTLKDWSENSRYRISSQLQAEDLFNAINETPDGALQWIKNFW